jgi:hypothetical protein
MEALQCMQAFYPDLPVVVVSGEVSEEGIRDWGSVV